MMMTIVEQPAPRLRGVLASLRGTGEAPEWVADLGRVIAPAGLEVRRASFGSSTLERVRAGGLVAAIVVADDGPTDALSQLRTIRSIDGALPCWLVAERAPRRLLQIALSLSVSSVIPHPVDVAGLGRSLLRVSLYLEEGN
jgi:hypothetical protein